MTTGFGSREKSRVAPKRIPMPSTHVKQEENVTSASDVPLSDEETPDVKPAVTPSAAIQITLAPKRSIVRLDINCLSGFGEFHCSTAIYH